MNIEELNKHFSINEDSSKLHFKCGAGDIPVVEISNSKGTAKISLQGAHVLSWKPLNEDDVIWLSKDATFSKGKSVRGGVPICWPWFGAHENNATFPAHGFARTVMWQVTDTKFISEEKTQITFRLLNHDMNENIQSMWPLETQLKYCITVGEKLFLELTTFNISDEAMVVGQALHTYFNINDVSDTTVYGLAGKTYLDKVESFKSKTQDGLIHINGEVDRVYLDTIDDIVINDKKRKINIKKKGSSSTVVWNPGQEVANTMGDLGKNGYRQMLCVESANAMTDVVTIKPHEKFILSVEYDVKQ